MIKNNLYSDVCRIMGISLLCLTTSFSLKAQNYCANEAPIFTENFGSGTSPKTNADITTGLTYQATGDLNDGFYRIVNNTQQRPEWHNAADHTGNTNGQMIVVNGSAQTFYQKTITNSPANFIPGSYAASLFLMNVNTPGTCSPNPLLPTITFIVEYNTVATGTTGWVQLQNVTATSVPQAATPTWVQLGGVFNLPVTAARIRLTLSDGVVSGCGNDFAIDDIKFATCPSGSPLPVQFLNLAAARHGSGVLINWSTATETNNRYFNVEKSTDAGNNWSLLSTVYTTGNSNATKNYNSYDAKPAGGENYYRIKQVDADGNFKYSITVRIDITIKGTTATVLNNPFTNTILVDLLSDANAGLVVQLTDIAGRQVASQKWSVSKGTNRQSLDNLNSLSKGLYIIAITDNSGQQVYNNKLVKM